MTIESVADLVTEHEISTSEPISLRDLALATANEYVSLILQDKGDPITNPTLVQVADSPLRGKVSRTGYSFSIENSPIFEIYGGHGTFNPLALQNYFIVRPCSKNQYVTANLAIAVSNLTARLNTEIP